MNPNHQTEPNNSDIHSEFSVEFYVPLVHQIILRMGKNLPNHISRDDLLSLGMLGLLEAQKRYDPSKGVKFETYATWRIRGAVLDGLRNADWVPRQIRTRAKEIEKAYNELEHVLLRSATDDEVASFMGLSIENFHQYLSEVTTGQCVSLENMFYADSDELASSERIADTTIEDPLIQMQKEEMVSLISNVIERLPEKERVVVSLYYYNELSFKEIADVLQVSTSRISQLHTKAIYRLRGALSRKRKDLKL